MSIVNSTFTPDAHAQRNGSRYIVENHEDSTGQTHVFVYLATPSMDPAAIMAARVNELNGALVRQDFDDSLNEGVLHVRHTTKAQLLALFREAYRNGEREQLARLAQWLIARVQAGDITPAQIQNTFNLTPAQYTTLRDKMISLKDHWDAVQSARGE